MSSKYSGGLKEGPRRPAPLILGEKEEIIEGRKAGRARKNETTPSPFLSSRSGTEVWLYCSVKWNGNIVGRHNIIYGVAWENVLTLPDIDIKDGMVGRAYLK